MDAEERLAKDAAKSREPGKGVEQHDTQEREETIGDRIRSRREALGWSQRKLAWKAGLYQDEATISNVTLNAIETNKTKYPSLGVLIPIAKALHVDVADLLRPGGALSESRSNEVLVYQLGAVMPNFADEQILAFALQFRQLSVSDKEFVLRIVNLLAHETSESERPPSSERRASTGKARSASRKDGTDPAQHDGE